MINSPLLKVLILSVRVRFLCVEFALFVTTLLSTTFPVTSRGAECLGLSW